MNDLQMHDNLSDANLRNAISQNLLAIYNNDKLPRPPLPQNGKLSDIALWRIECAKVSIKEQEEEISKARTMLAHATLMEMKGWDEYDVSDDVNYSGKLCRSFIGTQEEYDKLLESLGGSEDEDEG